MSVNKEESEAQHAFCNVKKEKKKEVMNPHAHTARTRFFPRSHPQNDPREDSASCFSFAFIRIRAASWSFCMDAHSALVRLCDREGFASPPFFFFHMNRLTETHTLTQPHERRVSIQTKRPRGRTDADESEAEAGR